MNSLVTFDSNSALLPTADFASGLERTVATELSSGPGSTLPILRMDRTGEWRFGPEAITPEPDSLWAVNPASLAHGWISWLDGRPAGEIMGSMAQPVMAQHELPPPPGEPWQREYAVQLQCVAGDDQGTTVLFKGGSIGVADVFAKLTPQIVARIRSGDGKIVPLVELAHTSYQHKQYGKIYKPVFEIKRWTAMTAPEAVAEETETDLSTATPEDIDALF